MMIEDCSLYEFKTPIQGGEERYLTNHIVYFLIEPKEELIFHVGFQQFIGQPTFSSEFINTDKNKMERFLHAGRFSVA